MPLSTEILLITESCAVKGLLAEGMNVSRREHLEMGIRLWLPPPQWERR